MSDDRAYYRSEHPALEEWWAEHIRRVQEYSTAWHALLEEFPDCTIAFREFLGNERAMGLFSATCPGPLWQRRRGHEHWTPRLKTAEGKALEKRLHAICYDPAQAPGMPASVRSALKRHAPGWFRHAGVAWLEWGVDAALVEASSEYDPAIWQRAKASDFYLAKERLAALEATRLPPPGEGKENP